MSRIVYYDDVKIIKKPLKSRLKLTFIFLFIFLILAGSIASAFYISKSITVGNIGSLFVYGGTELKIDESTMYMVSLGEYDRKEDAEKVSLGATVQGASGFIWEKDNKFYVVGSMYEQNSDAEIVKKNLLATSSYNISIVEVKFPKLKIKFDEYENKDVKTISDAIKYIDKVYSSIYDYSIKFDKSEMNNLAISSAISTLRGEGKNYINKIQTLLNSPDAKVMTIKEALIILDELLDVAIVRTIDNTGLNYFLKNTFVNVLKIKYDLYENLK